MPESLFGRPSQHLLSSLPQSAFASTSQMSSSPPAPVPSQPPSFAAFQFQKIGKQPDLLNRISEPDSNRAGYRSPSPESSAMSPLAIVSSIPQGPPSRPTLYQALGGEISHPSHSLEQVSRLAEAQASVHAPAHAPSAHASASHDAGSADDASLNNVEQASLRVDRSRYIKGQGSAQHPDLIPPIAFLAQASESDVASAPPKLRRPQAPQVQSLQITASVLSSNATNGDLPELGYPSPVPNMNDSAAPSPTQPALRITPAPGSLSLTTSATSNSAPSGSLSQIGTPMMSNSPPPAPSPVGSAQGHTSMTSDIEMAAPDNLSATLDSLAPLQAQLEITRHALQSLAPPPLSSRSPSPVPVSSRAHISQSLILELDRMAGTESEYHDQLEESVFLRNPYEPAASDPIHDGVQPENPLAVTISTPPTAPSQTVAVSRALYTHSATLLHTAQTLHNAAKAAVRVQVDAERLAAEQKRVSEEGRRALEEERQAFEVERRARQQELHQRIQELLGYQERLRAKEEELRLQEEERRSLDSKRRAKEEEGRAQNELRRQQLMSELDAASTIVEEIKAERERMRACAQAEPSDVMHRQDWVEAQEEEGMNDEEKKEIKNMQDLRGCVERLRRMHWQKVQQIDESDRTLRRLKEERLRAAEAERERVRAAEEERRKAVIQEERRRRAAAEAQRKAAAEEEERRKAALEEERQRTLAAEAEKRRKEAEEEAEQARRNNQAELLAKQQAHAEAQAQASQEAECAAELQRYLLEQQQRRQQEEFEQRRAEVTAARDQARAQDGARIRAERDRGLISRVEGATGFAGYEGTLMHVDLPSHPGISPPTSHSPDDAGAVHAPKTTHSPGRTKPVSGGVRLSLPRSAEATGSPKSASTRPRPTTSSSPDTANIASSKYGGIKGPSFVTAATEAGRQVATDTPLCSIALASELNQRQVSGSSLTPSTVSSLSISRPHAPPKNPKSQTVLDVASTSQELDIGPRAGVSPAQKNANLRHLRRTRSRIEESGSGDRSVRSEDGDDGIVKREETEVGMAQGATQPGSQVHEEKVQIPPTQTTTGRGSSTTERPSTIPSETTAAPAATPVIAPPRPKVTSKKVLTSVPQSSSDPRPPAEEASSSNSKMTASQLPEQVHRESWVMDASAAEDAEWKAESPPPGEIERWRVTSPRESTGGLSSSDPHDLAHEKDRASNYRAAPNHRAASGQSAARDASLEATSRRNASRSPDVDNSTYNSSTRYLRGGRGGSRGRRQSDHYSPPARSPQSQSPTLSHHNARDHWSPPQGASGIRVVSPVAGKKRAWEDDESEEPHQPRRARPDTYTRDRNRDSRDAQYTRDGARPSDHRSRATTPQKRIRSNSPDRQESVYGRRPVSPPHPTGPRTPPLSAPNLPRAYVAQRDRVAKRPPPRYENNYRPSYDNDLNFAHTTRAQYARPHTREVPHPTEAGGPSASAYLDAGSSRTDYLANQEYHPPQEEATSSLLLRMSDTQGPVPVGTQPSVRGGRGRGRGHPPTRQSRSLALRLSDGTSLQDRLSS
ncbi:hypothetical protein BV22DRAFT_1031731 [Leucogyrophana mollusca]|uniref:Uncharacterized protein n=1 Tax=Leucogyrophana mollusca TaxID=85980 RepID=A0ACB8BPI6_9AGAM|nr:hypothetical protein BV22DRAFT_1031731 [Leucogyrophana mollusca]